MFTCRALALAGLLAWSAAADELGDFAWREEFSDVRRWQPQPTWVGNPSQTAGASSDGGAACFRVDEAGRGMKWSAAMPMTPIGELPYLVVRYRAENVRTESDDYFVYLNDRVAGRQLNAIRLRDVAADGKWHVAAVDVTALTAAEAVYSMAVQVQAAKAGKARAWLDWLTFAPEPPKGAEVIRRVPAVPRRPDWVAPLAEARWLHHDDWLSNPAEKATHGVQRKGQVTVFRVAAAGRG